MSKSVKAQEIVEQEDDDANNNTIKQNSFSIMNIFNDSVTTWGIKGAIIGGFFGYTFGPLGMIGFALIGFFLFSLIGYLYKMYEQFIRFKSRKNQYKKYIQIIRWCEYVFAKGANKLEILTFINSNLITLLEIDSKEKQVNNIKLYYREFLLRIDVQEFCESILILFVRDYRIYSINNLSNLILLIKCCYYSFNKESEIPLIYQKFIDMYLNSNMKEFFKLFEDRELYNNNWINKGDESMNGFSIMRNLRKNTDYISYLNNIFDKKLLANTTLKEYYNRSASAPCVELDEPVINTRFSREIEDNQKAFDPINANTDDNNYTKDKGKVLTDDNIVYDDNKTDSDTKIQNKTNQAISNDKKFGLDNQTNTIVDLKQNIISSRKDLSNNLSNFVTDGIDIDRKDSNKSEMNHFNDNKFSQSRASKSFNNTTKKLSSLEDQNSSFENRNNSYESTKRLSKRIENNDIAISISNEKNLFKSLDDLIEFDPFLKHKIPINKNEIRIIDEFLSAKIDNSWKIFYQNEQTKIYKKIVALDNSDLIIIRAQTFLKGISVDNIMYNILNTTRRKQWDKLFNNFQVVEKNVDNNEIVYNSIKAPWPVADRDFLQWRYTHFCDNGSVIIHHRSTDHSAYQQNYNSSTIRAEVIISTYKITPAADGTNFNILTQTDIKGIIPRWLVNSQAAKAPLQWITNFNNACLELMNDYPIKVTS